MPTLAHVMGPVHDGLFMQPTDAEKLKVLLQEANNVDEPPSVDDVCAFVDLLKKYWTPADGSRELLALNRVVGTRRSVMGAYDHGFLQAQSALPWRHFSREGSNIFAYRSASTNRTLEGMSSPASMMQWMRDAGFSNVEDHVHPGWRVHGLRMKADRTNLGRNLMRPHLLKMQQRLANGYTVMLVAADSLANMAREKDHGQSALMRILGGHFMLAFSVDVRQDGAAFGLVTWGEEIEPKIEIPWSKIASWYRGFVCGQP